MKQENEKDGMNKTKKKIKKMTHMIENEEDDSNKNMKQMT